MKWSSPRLPLLCSFLTLMVVGTSGFRICAYSMKDFNTTKARNYLLVHTLTRIVSRCDISLLQEVKDPNGTAVKTLVSSLNRKVPRYEKYTFRSVSSEGLGNSPNNMQKYVFIYRTDKVNVTGQHQYRKAGSFLREPFVVQFRSSKTGIKDFILVPLNADHDQAVGEMDRLYDVFVEVSKKWNNTNVMFLGDFHASCGYMTRANKKNIRLFTDSKFTWLIGDKVDTTVTNQANCAYDRIVVYGRPFLEAIQPLSAKVFNFATEYKLTKSRALALSDHLPVEVRLKSSGLLLQATPLLILLSVSATVQSFLSAL